MCLRGGIICLHQVQYRGARRVLVTETARDIIVFPARFCQALWGTARPDHVLEEMLVVFLVLERSAFERSR